MAAEARHEEIRRKPPGLPQGPLLPVPGWLDADAKAQPVKKAQSCHLILHTVRHRIVLLCGIFAFTIAVAALLISIAGSSRVAVVEDSHGTLSEKRLPSSGRVTAPRPSLVLPEEGKSPAAATENSTLGSRGAAGEASRPGMHTGQPASWSPQTPDELAIWQRLGSRARGELAAIASRSADQGEPVTLQRASTETLAALAALARESELQAALSLGTPRSTARRASSTPGAPAKGTDAKEGGADSPATSIEQSSAAPVDGLSPPSSQQPARFAFQRVADDHLLGVLTSATAEIHAWQQALQSSSEPAILQLAALKRVTESSSAEAGQLLVALPDAVVGTGQPGSPTLVLTNVYASLVRRDSVETRFVLATELLTEPSALERALLVEALAAYGTVNHRGLLMLAQKDTDPTIQARATQILVQRQ